jgi:hypothetical protein
VAKRERGPRVHIPTPTLPNPNARDFYVRAGSLSSEGPATVPPPGQTFSLAQEEAELARNREAFKTLRAGFAFPYHEPPIRSFRHLLPHLAKFRSLARLLSLEARVKARKKDYAGAASSSLDALHMGHDIPRGGALINALVGIAVQAIGRRPLWDTARQLDAAEARAAAHRLETIRARGVSYADVMTEEKWVIQAGLAEAFRDGSPLKMLRDMSGSGGGPSQLWQDLQLQYRFLRKGKRRILSDNAAYLDRLIADAKQPFNPDASQPPVPDDPINAVVLPVFAQVRLKFVDTETQNALLNVVLALRAYRLERGHYPERLGDLVPRYLSRVPDDPCARRPNVPLRYRAPPATGTFFTALAWTGRMTTARP